MATGRKAPKRKGARRPVKKMNTGGVAWLAAAKKAYFNTLGTSAQKNAAAAAAADAVRRRAGANLTPTRALPWKPPVRTPVRRAGRGGSVRGRGK